jgi:hypothetical protein
MNLSFVESIPPGSFEEISVEMPDWERKFKSLIQQRKHIKFEFAKMPNIPDNLLHELAEQNYAHIILRSGDGQRFLVPGSN